MFDIPQPKEMFSTRFKLENTNNDNYSVITVAIHRRPRNSSQIKTLILYINSEIGTVIDETK